MSLDMINDFETPILLIVFNRPETTRKVFSKIRELKPKYLFVAADGPRKNVLSDKENCKKVKRIIETIDWDCELRTLYRDENNGCKIGVSSAITWFFNQVDQGIILEDDCLPNLSFFKYCDTLLNEYKLNEKIMSISGTNFQNRKVNDASYYFSKYLHCWGWATWKRAWKNFDVEMKEWPTFKDNNKLGEIFAHKTEIQYWKNIFDKTYLGKIDSWAYIWTFDIYKNSGINIIPNENLISNIGFGEDATHTKSVDSPAAFLKQDEMEFPLDHPENINVSVEADRYTFKNIYKRSFTKRILDKIRKICF